MRTPDVAPAAAGIARIAETRAAVAAALSV